MFHPSQFTVTSSPQHHKDPQTPLPQTLTSSAHHTSNTPVAACARAAASLASQRPAMKSSSGALRLKLKQEQAGDGSRMQGSGGLSSSLELRLGISSDNGGSNDPWLGVGVHQRPPPAQPVGWPPVGAFRKSHLAGVKSGEEPCKAAVKAGGSGERPAAAASMFVKVNLEGCGVGRKVDLLAHRGYASLSRALQAMFHGFMADGQWRIAAGREDDDGEPKKKDRETYILLYEDNEGDRMLVGDVPWELFMASVKRLYIAQDPRKS